MLISNLLWRLDKAWEGNYLGEFCVESRLFLEGLDKGMEVKGSGWCHCVLASDCVRVSG